MKTKWKVYELETQSGLQKRKITKDISHLFLLDSNEIEQRAKGDFVKNWGSVHVKLH